MYSYWLNVLDKFIAESEFLGERKKKIIKKTRAPAGYKPCLLSHFWQDEDFIYCF